ncbi:MAG: hypothetical protein HQK57_15580 [Deltaproteobacteria bacterium]|nr:hypothetical protein [Deltaproteobacteria bacterium]
MSGGPFEVALAGKTSETVEAGIDSGDFGVTQETGSMVNRAIKSGAGQGLGLGAAVGQRLLDSDCPYSEFSLLAQSVKLGRPATVHVALGTDVIHIHPEVDGAAVGQTCLTDFRTFASRVAQLEGGVLINLGSAVIMPEVFLKALTLVRNLGHKVKEFTTVNMDFMRQYRPTQNVVRRPTQGGGQGFELIGHHEIMFPLLAAALIEAVG